MSLIDIDVAIDRIKVATSGSPIALFFANDEEKVEAVFADTAKTRTAIRRRDPGFIGIFTQHDDAEDVLEIIQEKIMSNIAVLQARDNRI